MKILAGIVLYHPDIERLKENLEGVYGQVGHVVLIDNTQKETGQEVLQLINDYERCTLISNGDNLGMAHALNQIFQYGSERDYDWILTLDQDSVCLPGMIENYLKYINLPSAGILTCRMTDRNFKGREIKKNLKDNICEEKECITSGAFCSVEAYRNSDGFDDQMFIDCVDFDYCYNLRKHGYKIYYIEFTGLLHELGKGKDSRFLWRRITILHESPFRHYYFARNHFYLAWKYPEETTFAKEVYEEFHQWVKTILYEDQKIKKLKARLRGLKDVRKMKKKS